MVVLANIAIGFRHEPPIFLKIAAYPPLESRNRFFASCLSDYFHGKIGNPYSLSYFHLVINENVYIKRGLVLTEVRFYFHDASIHITTYPPQRPSASRGCYCGGYFNCVCRCNNFCHCQRTTTKFTIEIYDRCKHCSRIDARFHFARTMGNNRLMARIL